MTRHILFWTAFLSLAVLTVQGQTKNENFKEIGRNDSLQLKVIKQTDNLQYFLVIKSKRKTDSLSINDSLFYEFDKFNLKTDTCFITTKQLDNRGKEEIILCWHIEESGNLGEHGGYICKKIINEVWNIDTQERLFSSVSKYEYSSDYIDWPTDSTATETITDCSYKYDFSFDYNNRIVIRNLQTNYVENCSLVTPDKKVGVYFLKNGRYIKTEN
jgi:hypothetical protein